VPSQALGLAVLTAVLAAALVSAPLMLASAEQGTWEQERERLSEPGLGTTLRSTTISPMHRSSPGRMQRLGEFDAAVGQAGEDVGMGTPLTLTVLRNPIVAFTPTGGAESQIVFRSGAEDEVEIVAGEASADGVLIPEGLAEATGAGPGDVLTIAGTMEIPAQLRVSGVYVVPTAPLSAYWEGFAYLFLPFPNLQTGELDWPPLAILAPQEVAWEAATAIDEDLTVEWFIPLDRGIGVDAARAAVDDMDQLQITMTDPEKAVSALVAEEGFQRPGLTSTLPAALENVDRTVDLLAPPVRAVGVGGGAAALVLIGAWAGHRMRRRDDELRSLVARGLSPARGAWDAVREALVPVLVGSALGGAGGWLLVREFGPAADVPPGVLPTSLLVLVAGAAAALVAIATITAAQLTRFDSIGRGPAAALLGRVPWLAVTAAVTVVAVVPLVTGDRGTGGKVDVLTLAVPLLVTVVVAGVVTGVLPRIGSRADARLRRLPAGPFLAARRVLAGQGAARLVVVTTALSLGLVVYAGALADSTARTIDAKASVATGSDVVVPVAQGSVADGDLPAGAMAVGVETGAALLPAEDTVDVLVVRPERVPGIVRWNDDFADRPLTDLMTELSDYDGDRVPVILAGPVSDNVLQATDGELTLDFQYYAVPIEIVGRADAFPGQDSRDPLLVADWDRYTAAIEAEGRSADLILTREVWSRGDADTVLPGIVAAGYADDQSDYSTAAQFAARPELTAQTWSLAYLRAIALAAGVLGLVGVAMHALAQQRRRTVAGLLLRRMGMTRRSADGAAGLEIGLLTGLGAVVAVLVALPASALVLRLLDPVPTLQPDPLFTVPWGSLAVVVAGVVVVTGVGAALVGRSARRATGGQVMRDAS
jgi:putative ABC transport system permease protein